MKQTLYGKQTQLALNNFHLSGQRLPASFIHSLALIKACAAKVNAELGLLSPDLASAIVEAAEAVAAGEYEDQFPVDVFQTGSGTSTNMNVNEVVASLAGQRLGREVHPNDHVNRGQSSNDVIPTAIHLSASLALQQLLAALRALADAITARAGEFAATAKNGRTHLMDAVPMTLGQELSGWAEQIHADMARLDDTARRLRLLAQGGTAVGTGLNTHPDFARRFADELSRRTGLPLEPAPNAFSVISSQDTALELSGQLRVTATSLLKMATDLRWMNSGPISGLAEIELPELQPGSSIMPGKVNPVIPEAVGMACVQVIGLDTAITLAAQDNRFQLATMLPLIAYDLLMQLSLLQGAVQSLQEQAIAVFTVNQEALAASVERNTMLVTALTPVIGYDLAGRIARSAASHQRSVLDVALELTDLEASELERLLDPVAMAKPHEPR